MTVEWSGGRGGSKGRACAVWALVAAVGVAAPAYARPDAPKTGELWKFATGDKVESHPSPGGAFRIHFTRAGAHAVPLADADGDGLPDHVAALAVVYDDALAFYSKLGLPWPIGDGTVGGDARFDVYLIDFAGKADGTFVQEACSGHACSGFLVQENDFSGYAYPTVAYANRVLASHELFHAVQAAIDTKQSQVMSEGTAVWATEQFDPSLKDFENFLPGFLQHPERSLDKPMPGPVDPFSYGSAIFFQFLSERFGPKAVVQLWMDCKDGANGVADPDWFTALGALLVRDHMTTFAIEFKQFAVWNLRTGGWAEAGVGYANAAKYPAVATTSATMPHIDDDLRVFYASAQYLRLPVAGRAAVTAALAAKTDPASLRIGLAARKGKQFGEWLWIVPPFAPPFPSLDCHGAEEVVVALVNTAQAGESVRGRLCVGGQAEIAPCLPPSAVAEPSADAGGADADPAARTDAAGSDGTGPDAADASAGPAVDGGGCAAGGRSPSGWLPASAVAAVWRWRRRGACPVPGGSQGSRAHR